MGVVASGLGDVDVACGADRVDGQVAQGGEVRGGVAGAGLAVVLAEGDVQDVVARLARPVPLLDRGEVAGPGLGGFEAGDRVYDLPALPSALADRAAMSQCHHHLLRAGEVHGVGGSGAQHPPGDAPVSGSLHA